MAGLRAEQAVALRCEEPTCDGFLRDVEVEVERDALLSRERHGLVYQYDRDVYRVAAGEPHRRLCPTCGSFLALAP